MQEQMTIMVVDDDSTFRFILNKQLGKDPIFNIVKEAVNGEDAITFLSDLSDNSDNPSTYPDLILLDINMPIMDGWQFLDEFSVFNKKRNTTIPVCMLSSTINQIDFDKSKTYHSVQHFFTKPINSDDMMKMKELHKKSTTNRMV